MEETEPINVFIANCSRENWQACAKGNVFGLKQGNKYVSELKPGDLILLRITGPEYGVKVIWYLDRLVKVTNSTEVPWHDATYEWLLECKPLAELSSLFTEEFKTTSKLSQKIPNLPATRIMGSMILLKASEASAYLEAILSEFASDLNIEVEYMGKRIVVRELLISLLQRVQTEELGVEEEDTVSADQITEPYDPSKIKVDLKPFPVFQIMRKIKLGEIDLQPDFQRHVVWDDIRQSRLIESMLIRIPLPAFYLDAVNEHEWLVVDGLQRLSTLDRFINRQDLRLQGLEFLGNELKGLTFDELPRHFQREIEEAHLSLYLIQPETPARVKFTIFTRINTGGLVLTAQEIRHCLFQGPATKMLATLADTPEFISATTNSISSKRMDDRECVLRFCAFHLTPYTQYEASNWDSFLSQAMIQINQMSEKSRVLLQNNFLDSMVKAKSVFGPYAFRKIEESSRSRYPINKALFEVWSVNLEKFSLSELTDRKELILRRFTSIIQQDYQFLKSISQATGSISSVQKRFSTIETLLREVIK